MRSGPRSPSNTEAGKSLAGLGSLVAGGAVARGLSAYRLLLFAPLMGPEAFGAFRIAQTAALILSGATTLGLPAAHARYLPGLKSAEQVALLRRLLLLMLVSSVGFVVLLLPFAATVSNLLFSAPGYMMLAVAVILTPPLAGLWRSLVGAAQGMGKLALSARAEALHSMLFLLLGLPLVLMFRGNAVAGYAAYLVTLLIGCCWLWRRLALATTGQNPPARMTKRALVYSSWVAIIPVTQYLLDFIDRWMIARHLSLDMAGAYSVIPALAGGMFLFGSALGTIALQRGSSLWAADRKHHAVVYTWACIRLAVVLSLAYAMLLRLAEPLIWNLLGERWAAAAVALPILLVYFTLHNSYWVLGSLAAFAERTWIHLLACILGATTTTLLCLALVPSHGVLGAAWATVAGQCAMQGTHLAHALAAGLHLPLSGLAFIALAGLNLLPTFGFVAAVIVVFLLLPFVLPAVDRELIADFFQRLRSGGGVRR